MDNLSAAANVLAVASTVSIVGTIIEAAVGLDSMISKLKNCTTSMRTLQNELRHLSNAIVRVDALRTPGASQMVPSPVGPQRASLTALDGFTATLDDCQRTLAQLRISLSDLQSKQTNGLLAHVLGSANYVRREEEIRKMTAEIERQKTTILLYLMASTKDDASNTRGDVAHVREASDHIRDDIVQVRESTIQAQESVRRIADGTTAIRAQLSSFELDTRTASIRSRDQFEVLRTQVDTRFDDIIRQFANKPFAAHMPIDTIVRKLVTTGKIEPQIDLITPLHAAQQLLDHNLDVGEEPFKQFLSDELGSLLESAHMASIELLQSRRSMTLSSDKTVRHVIAKNALPNGLSIAQASSVLSAQSDRHVYAREVPLIEQLIQSVARFSSWSLGVWQSGRSWQVLRVETWPEYSRDGLANKISMFLRYTPPSKSGRTRRGILLHVDILHHFNAHHFSAVPSILRNLTPFIYRPSTASIFTSIKVGDFDGFKKALNCGHASITDHDEEGWSLLVYTAVYNQPKMYSYLLDHGMDQCEPTALHLGGSSWTAEETAWYLATDRKACQDVVGRYSWGFTEEERSRFLDFCRQVTSITALNEIDAEAHFRNTVRKSLSTESIKITEVLYRLLRELLDRGMDPHELDDVLFDEAAIPWEVRDSVIYDWAVAASQASTSLDDVTLPDICMAATPNDPPSRLVDFYKLITTGPAYWVSSESLAVLESENRVCFFRSSDDYSSDSAISRSRKVTDMNAFDCGVLEGVTQGNADEARDKNEREYWFFDGCNKFACLNLRRVDRVLQELKSWETDGFYSDDEMAVIMRCRLNVLIALLRHGADPNHESVHEYIDLTNLAPVERWIWLTALRETGHTVEYQRDTAKYVRTATPLRGRSALDKKFAFQMKCECVFGYDCRRDDICHCGEYIRDFRDTEESEDDWSTIEDQTYDGLEGTVGQRPLDQVSAGITLANQSTRLAQELNMAELDSSDVELEDPESY